MLLGFNLLNLQEDKNKHKQQAEEIIVQNPERTLTDCYEFHGKYLLKFYICVTIIDPTPNLRNGYYTE